MTKYIALLRGINVGGNKRVSMTTLKSFLESLGFVNVKTYINSGNVFFESNEKIEKIQDDVNKKLRSFFGFNIPTLIKSQKEVAEIVKSIPETWVNNKDQKTDVAYLFSEADNSEVINNLPINKNFLEMKYTKGAIIWNVNRKNYNKSRLNKIINHKMYNLMTIRNVNTA